MKCSKPSDPLLFALEVFVAHPSQAEDHPAVLVEVHAVVLVSVQVFEDEVHWPLVGGVLHMTEMAATFRTRIRCGLLMWTS